MRLFAGTEFDVPPTCDRCGVLEEDCQCPPPAHEWLAPEKQIAKIRVEKRKRGKVVTLIMGLDASESDLPALLTKLKDTCGAGGTIGDSGVEIQGQHQERVADVLAKMGYRMAK